MLYFDFEKIIEEKVFEELNHLFIDKVYNEKFMERIINDLIEYFKDEYFEYSYDYEKKFLDLTEDAETHIVSLDLFIKYIDLSIEVEVLFEEIKEEKFLVVGVDVDVRFV